METILSAVLGELITRSVNFFISKLSKPQVLDVDDRLCRVLLRAKVISDEAMGRHVTNQAMLHHLDILRDAMHRGCYMLDTFRCQSYDGKDTKDQVVSHSLSLSKVNSLKGSCSTIRNLQIFEKLKEALDTLSSMILDMEELFTCLLTYPCLYSQPYSMHLQLVNCMFGRQMEAEFVINFLLQPQAHGVKGFDVIPIVGPGQVGKSTLVAHVCKDERVRDHFSEILFFHIHGFTDDEIATFRDGCQIKHQNRVSDSNFDGRLLVVIELIGDFSEDAWNRLYSTSICCMPSGSKIIVTSRSDKILKFGTTQAVTLNYLSHEAYWYFFKTLTFGSTDPEMHPRLLNLAMEIARMQSGCLIGANVIAGLLRDNFDIQFWCKVLAFLRWIHQKHVSRFGESLSDHLNKNKQARLGRMATASEDLVLYHQYQCSSEEEVPKIRMKDVMYGNMRPCGKFEALVWRSSIPPYYSYACTCKIQDFQTRAVKRKRTMKT